MFTVTGADYTGFLYLLILMKRSRGNEKLKGVDYNNGT